MKAVILVRHGFNNESTGNLTNDGKILVSRLAENLKPHLDGMTFKIVSSPEPRAIQSAEIIANILKVSDKPIDTDSYLQDISKDFFPELLDAMRQFADGIDETGTDIEGAEKFDALISATHLGIVEFFPKYVAEKYFNATLDHKCHGISKSTAWIIKEPINGVCELIHVSYRI